MRQAGVRGDAVDRDESGCDVGGLGVDTGCTGVVDRGTAGDGGCKEMGTDEGSVKCKRHKWRRGRRWDHRWNKLKCWEWLWSKRGCEHLWL